MKHHISDKQALLYILGLENFTIEQSHHLNDCNECKNMIEYQKFIMVQNKSEENPDIKVLYNIYNSYEKLLSEKKSRFSLIYATMTLCLTIFSVITISIALHFHNLGLLTAEKSSGEVFINENQLFKSANVSSKNIIITQAEGSCKILYKKEILLELLPNTNFFIEDINVSLRHRYYRFILNKGNVNADFNNPNKKFSYMFITKHSNIYSNGTKFSLQVTPDKTSVKVSAGSVYIENRKTGNKILSEINKNYEVYDVELINRDIDPVDQSDENLKLTIPQTHNKFSTGKISGNTKNNDNNLLYEVQQNNYSDKKDTIQKKQKDGIKKSVKNLSKASSKSKSKALKKAKEKKNKGKNNSQNSGNSANSGNNGNKPK